MTEINYDLLWEAYIRDFKKAYFQNDFDKARTILESAFSDAEDYAEIDFRLVASTHSLASSYAQAERESDAADLFQRFIELREKVLGPEDPDVADSLEQIAILQLSKKQKTNLKKAI
ncbi:MAG: tetratricopeptide repeat protein [Candidatus Melainabacteria bacterium]|nr:tetratricopeptide repeat protein [Candidatus Melainabacteria bacterium]